MHIGVDCLRWTLVVFSALAWTISPIGGSQQPPIRSGVELVLIDAQVIDRQGSPITSLRPGDFEILIDGKKRKVAAAVLVQYPTPGAHTMASQSPEVAPGSDRRQFMLAVDEHSFAPGAAMAAVRASGRFIERLTPADLVGLYTVPNGAGSAEFSNRSRSRPQEP